MVRALILGACSIVFGQLLAAATLEQLGLDDMTAKSTAIVRAHVTGSYTAASGAMIYTHYRLAVTERWKGPEASTLDVVVPGGTAGVQRQSFSGAPKLEQGRDYVLFLWTGTRGLTYIIGLSQGLFELSAAENGEIQATRAASGELMFSPSGKQVHDQALRMSLKDLRQRVSRAASQGAVK